jgi:lysophospholipase L1-like esterase
VTRRVAAHGSAKVIDMLEASRGSSLRTSPHFTQDGVHLSPSGNAALGKLIAGRVVRDLKRRPGDGD